MTQEEKAIAYDKAIEKIKYIMEHGVSPVLNKEDLQDLFPEIQETDDEKIRKWIIDDIRYNMNNEPLNNSEYKKEAEKAIAWLEKQGEQKSAVDFKAEDWYVSKVDGKIHNIYNSGVEPKFKVGDWVVNNTTLNVCYILKIEHGQYICDDCSFPITKENEYHLWTILDAKDGDILASRHEQPKESEDERISREITEFILTHRIDEPNDIEDTNPWLAWLEKQGESNPYSGVSFEYNGNIWGMCARDNGVDILLDEQLFKHLEKQGKQNPKDKYTFKSIPRLLEMIKPTDRAKAYCQKLIDSLLQEGYATDAKIVSDCLKQMNGEKVAMATMDEQNPTDKIEPKFKVGDWITCEELSTAKIVNINGDRYEVEFIDGRHSKSPHIDYVDRLFHIWSIKDAKPGDVLASKDEDDILIFRNLDGNTSFSSYYNIRRRLEIGWSNRSFIPATKEQHDRLFAKMKKAGLKWDDDKKKLKKIEDEEYNGEDYGIDSLYHAQRILEKTLGKVDGYLTDDGILSHKCAITAVKKLCEQKPKWSEEDETYLGHVFTAVKAYYTDDKGKENPWREELLTWLKSLKDRVQPQPKQEWNKEDESILQGIWDEILANKHDAKEYEWKTYDKFLDWLKSLKQRMEE